MKLSKRKHAFNTTDANVTEFNIVEINSDSRSLEQPKNIE